MYVTRDFGRELLAEDVDVPLQGRRTVLSALRDHHEAIVDPDTGLVQAVDGLRFSFPGYATGDPSLQAAAEQRIRREGRDPTPSSWATNVNGIETDPLPARLELHPGDVVQWDLRDWNDLLDVRATVGAFPQPFTGGMYGDRFPTSVSCERAAALACDRVKAALRSAGVRLANVAERARGVPAGQVRRARIFVGRWNRLRTKPAADFVEGGPRYSGVFARFTADGTAMRLFDWDARPVSVSGAGSGLVAAVKPTEAELIWFVTGVDHAGVRRAAAALDSDGLENAFALAVDADGSSTKLPLEPPRYADRER